MKTTLLVGIAALSGVLIGCGDSSSNASDTTAVEHQDSNGPGSLDKALCDEIAKPSSDKSKDPNKVMSLLPEAYASSKKLIEATLKFGSVKPEDTDAAVNSIVQLVRDDDAVNNLNAMINQINKDCGNSEFSAQQQKMTAGLVPLAEPKVAPYCDSLKFLELSDAEFNNTSAKGANGTKMMSLGKTALATAIPLAPESHRVGLTQLKSVLDDPKSYSKGTADMNALKEKLSGVGIIGMYAQATCGIPHAFAATSAWTMVIAMGGAMHEGLDPKTTSAAPTTTA